MWNVFSVIKSNVGENEGREEKVLILCVCAQGLCEAFSDTIHIPGRRCSCVCEEKRNKRRKRGFRLVSRLFYYLIRAGNWNGGSRAMCCSSTWNWWLEMGEICFSTCMFWVWPQVDANYMWNAMIYNSAVRFCNYPALKFYRGRRYVSLGAKSR